MYLKLPVLSALLVTNELWGENLARLHGISDIAIAVSYYTVSLLIIYLINQRKDISFTLLLWLLSFFFISCGTTYVINLENISHPHYQLEGYAEGLTAILALVIVIRLLLMMPQILHFPSSQQLQNINERLNQEIAQFQVLDKKIRSLNTQLEQKIEERTAELKQVNQQLTVEIEERKQIAATLHHQIQLEQLIGHLSHCFINVTATKLDSTINEALSSISEFVGVDGSCLLLFTKQNQQFPVVQKWSVPESGNLSNSDQLIESQIPWIISKIQSNEIVNLPTIDSLPAVERDRLYLTANNIKSLLVVPIFYDAAVQGMLTLEAVNQSHSWTETDIQLLKLIGEIISGAIERCRQATELATRTQQLETSNQELEQFAYIVSHDLSEPLRSISGFSYLLQEEYQGKLDQEAQEYLDFIKEGTARMKQLIDDLLAFSRVGSQKSTLTLIDCEKVIEEVIANLQAAIMENNVQIHYDNLPKIIADRTQLTQLWQNLIANAIKFRKPELTPQIHISASQNSQNLIFTIRDNGIGIDPQYVEEIFGVFRRLNDRQKYPGTGIGLAICRRIAELHGGKIWVESSLGNGSNFYVFLPIRNQPELGHEDNN